MHGAPRRLRFALLNRLSNRPPRSQRVYVVTIAGHRFKRIVFPDSHHAARVATRLHAFAGDGVYPRPILERERELWVEFVEGRPVAREDAELLPEMARLLSVLMKRDPREVPLVQTPWLTSLQTDLAFLEQVGVLESARAAALAEVAERLAPARVWQGYDCSDAILKNFVWDGAGRLRAVDVESLAADQLLGLGVAKAAVRWLGDERDQFLDLLQALEVPGFESYFAFVELSFRTFWQKSSFLEKKRRFLDPSLFDRFLGGP